MLELERIADAIEFKCPPNNHVIGSGISNVLENIGISGEDIIFHEGESETQHFLTFPYAIDGRTETIYIKYQLPDSVIISVFHSYGDIPVHVLEDLKSLVSYMEKKLIYGNFRVIKSLNTIEFSYRMYPYRLLKSSFKSMLVSFLETSKRILPHIRKLTYY